MNSHPWPKTGTLLFIGPKDSHASIYTFAKEVLCKTQQDFDLFEAGSHPDFQMITPETSSKVIKIEQIRVLQEWACTQPKIAACKTAIFNPAEAMTVQAANALLKTLEEPSARTLFILVTTRPHLLLKTIKSRCYIIHNRQENFETSLRSRITEDLKALGEGSAEPVKTAETWLKEDIQCLLNAVFYVLYEEVKNCVLQGQKIQNKVWWKFLDEILKAKQLIENHLQINQTLLLETLLIQYVRMKKVL